MRFIQFNIPLAAIPDNAIIYDVEIYLTFATNDYSQISSAVFLSNFEDDITGE